MNICQRFFPILKCQYKDYCIAFITIVVCLLIKTHNSSKHFTHFHDVERYHTNMIEVDFSQHRIINKAMSQSWFEEIKESCIKMRGWGVERKKRSNKLYTSAKYYDDAIIL